MQYYAIIDKNFCSDSSGINYNYKIGVKKKPARIMQAENKNIRLIQSRHAPHWRGLIVMILRKPRR